MKLSKAVALRITNLLLKNDMSQYRLIKNTGIAPSTIQDIMKEKTSDVRLSTIAIVAEGLGVTLKEFFNDKLFDTIDFDI